MKIDPLVVSVSARTLFDFNEEDAIYKKDGIEKYNKVQKERIDTPAPPGVAFSLIKKLLSFNSDNEEYIKIIISSKNEPFTGLRVFNSFDHYGLKIQSGFFTGGTPVHEYLDSFATHLFLSGNIDSVKAAAANGIPSAHMSPGKGIVRENDVLRLAFDIDCVIFGNEAEKVFQEEGLDEFRKSEIKKSEIPLKDGPFIKLLEFMHKLKNLEGKNFQDRIRTALITSRGMQVFKRPIKTLIQKGVNVDEIFFLCGEPKREIIEKFSPDAYFDDQIQHLENIARAGHVPDIVTDKRNEDFAKKREATLGKSVKKTAKKKSAKQSKKSSDNGDREK